MSGYIAITTQEWIENIKSLGTGTAVYWNKKASFKALDKGEPFYFLRRSPFSSNADRYIAGRGFFSSYFRLHPQEAWMQFGQTLGFKTKESFESKISRLYRDKIEKISCIKLDGIEFFVVEPSIEMCGIDFSAYIVSGKKLNNNECMKIENSISG